MSLRQKTLSAVKWNLLSTVTTVVLGIISLWALSHILTVEQYGVISAALIISNFIMMLLDFGISNSIVRSKSIQKIELSSLAFINILMGVGAFIFTFIFSSYLAELFGASQSLNNQIKIMSLAFVFISFGLQPKALLTREMDFSALSKISIITAITNFILSVSLALTFHATWCVAIAFVISMLVSSLLSNFYAKDFMGHGYKFERRQITSHFKYGMQLVLDSLVNQVSINTYPVLMSRLISLAAIGGYNISYNISIALFEKLNPVLSHALFPAFAKISDDESKLKLSFLKVTAFSAMVNFPILIGMLLVSKNIINVFFDPKWFFITPIVQVLCIVGLIRSLDTPVISILLVKAQMFRNVFLGIFKLVLGIPLTWFLGKNFGVLGIVYGFLIVQFINTFSAYFILLKPCLEIRFFEYGTSILIPLLHVIPMFLFGLCMNHWLSDNIVFLNLVVTIVTCMLVYCLTLILSPFHMVKEFRGIVFNSFIKKVLR